jgi:hypothetical protein
MKLPNLAQKLFTPRIIRHAREFINGVQEVTKR